MTIYADDGTMCYLFFFYKKDIEISFNHLKTMKAKAFYFTVLNVYLLSHLDEQLIKF